MEEVSIYNNVNKRVSGNISICIENDSDKKTWIPNIISKLKYIFLGSNSYQNHQACQLNLLTP